jgi:hypothetical protein
MKQRTGMHTCKILKASKKNSKKGEKRNSSPFMIGMYYPTKKDGSLSLSPARGRYYTHVV